MNIDSMEKRYSVKGFDPEKTVKPDDLDVLKKVFHLSPSSVNSQAWKLIVVENPELKSRLAEAGQDTNKERIRECSHLLVFCRKKLSNRHLRKVIGSTEILKIQLEKRGLKEFHMVLFFWFYWLTHGRNEWLNKQLYLAMGFVMSACADLDIGSLPMEGINKAKINKILNLGADLKTQVVLAIGYPNERDMTNPSRLKKSRLPYDEIVETRV